MERGAEAPNIFNFQFIYVNFSVYAIKACNLSLINMVINNH